MADSELGELRRPPRLVEQRIHRLASWRAQGLAGGTSDDVFPADGDDDVLASDGDSEAGGGDLPQWFADSFDVTSTSSTTVVLSYVPLFRSEIVRLNGVTLDPLTEYTIDGASLTLTTPSDLRLGIGSQTWKLVVSYAYTEPADNEVVYGYSQDVDPIAGGSVTITEPVYEDDVALLFVLGTTTAVSGVYATWELVYQASGSSFAWMNTKVYKGTGIGSGSAISITTDGTEPSFANGRVLIVLREAADYPFAARTSDSDLVASLSHPGSLTVETAAAVGDLVVLAVRSRNNTTTANFIEDPSGWVTTGLTVLGSRRSHVGATYGNGIGVLVGVATAANPSAVAETANGGGEYVDFGIAWSNR
jgi:hypothetical protein